MVTVHRFDGLRIVIFSNDHEPAHVHVVGPKAEAKVQLSGSDGLTLLWQFGFGHHQMRRIMVEVQRERSALLGRWREIHG